MSLREEPESEGGRRAWLPLQAVLEHGSCWICVVG